MYYWTRIFRLFNKEIEVTVMVGHKPNGEELEDLFTVDHKETRTLKMDKSTKDETITINLSCYDFISATQKDNKLVIKLKSKDRKDSY
jgi:hypothetical protein